jgi:hypothetical protein
MPSGRHVEGSLQLGFGSDCGPLGLQIEFDLLTESAPGAGDEIWIAGTIQLSFADARLYLSVGLHEEVHLAEVHATDVGACLVIDLPARLLAIDGSALHTVDGEPRHGLRIEDLQSSICEQPPYTGTVEMYGPTHNVQVAFDRTTPDDALLTVVTDDASTEVDLPVLRLPGPLCADLPAVPLEIDYVSCGGCGQPDPGDGDFPGGDGSPGGDDPFGGDDPGGDDPGGDDPGGDDPGGDDPGGGDLPGSGDDLPGGDPDDAMD